MKQGFLFKGFFLPILTLGLLICSAPAQETPPTTPPPPPTGHGPFDFLSKADLDRIKLAREDVFANIPDLKTEEDNLKAEGQALHENKDATKDDRKAFADKMKAHLEAMKAAMIQEDPSLQAIFDVIDQHMKQMHGHLPPPPVE